ncbi:MAG: DUF5611 family protein [Thermoplasmata archaeon]
MQRYPVRASHRAGLRKEALEILCREHFGSAELDGDKIRASFGALASLTVWVDGKELAVEVEMQPKVEPELQAETVQRYYRFLTSATGYSSKERASRLRKSAARSGG